MIPLVSRFKSLVVWVVLVQVALISSVSADTRITDDYIALVVEAEDDESRGERWVLTNSQTGTQENDPDGNHSDGAAGGAYIELLPDMRVTHDDEFGPPTAYWDTPGTGPQAVYPMTFPEAGRYYVHIRAYSTGTEDNGIHVGLNDNWPQSGARMQFCTAGRGWQWSGRQRDSGGVGPCGAEKTIWVTVEEPGEHRFMISAREDGFEADKIMLIKDLTDNTRICSPSGTDDITCVNGSLENADDVVDMEVTSSISASEIGIDGSVVVSVVVRNDDGYDAATNVALTLDANIGTVWNAAEVSEGCEVSGADIVCAIGYVSPSGPDGQKEFEFTLEPLQAGELAIPISVSTDSVDGTQGNDSADVSVVVDDSDTLAQLSLSWSDQSLTWEAEMETTVAATVANAGPADAQSVVLSVSIPAGLSVTTQPDTCTGVNELECTFPVVALDGNAELSLGITPAAAGMYSISVSADAANLSGEAVNSTIIIEAQEAGTAAANNASSGGAASGWSLLLLTSLLAYRRKTRLSA